ncbi:golgin subfamily A member 3 isoform X1 [Physeter macrocephalus]|uniref:Golgin subfamily A member 3 isoform X1 n=1 Tax=Physeter macrocephalus TaxID=9755 RepID=A0A2Y9FMK1_PHYMC|nr:golgin subfamily A member 3 isoform X1 [Physeter catodon]XP_054936354.1 golgin subfamily A member 3 isoform X1 [Physeter catodon]XP_054936355.1 golgin subfamily A member 3 isoform X1 [Physeter catodon]XP_054936356.1 golgin subfamily A member 3 isoform X1 [Physeter catodon]|eukprot:XP_023976515.1 golgin subfamily A member 3 isoform X3 [Physeter catodon]
MDGAAAVQEGLLEDRPGSGVSARPEDPPKPTGSLTSLDRWDEAQCAGVEVNRASDEGGSQGDTCPNGPAPHFPDPPLTVGPEASPGVADFHDNLRKSQGTSAEGSVRKEALQSLRLSLPMQETQLCSTEASLPLEKEEQVRLQARKRLEEQLKQYRVKRQQERSSQPVTKTRLFSTLDPELMLNPETLPRASAVAMTKEYSFLRTSVPRGPKVGSLGLLAHPKEKKSFKSSKIRSLADYRTEDSDARNSGGNVPAPDSARASLEQNRGSGTSVVSELSLCPEADDRLEDASLVGDNVSEADGTESDSSSYSSVSARGTAGLLVNTGGVVQAPGGVSSREIAASALGQLPSISDVLRAAAAERQEQKVNGETRRRADSICSSVSMESSVAETQDEMLQVLKEKMRLEGQLEALSLEASQALKEKAELQAQLAALHTRLQAQLEQSHSSQQRQDSLSSEVDTLKQSCWDLEQAMSALQNMLEAKNASLASSNSDLRLAEGQYQRLMAKVEEMQRSVLSKDSTVHDLRQQMTALQSQLQQVQLERTTLTSKLKASQAEIASLQSVRQWYQQQLALAQEARVRLQGEMTHIQIGQMSQAGLLEHLKLENVSLSHQLTETQQRSIKEKERIAAQLQGIEADMLDQEAALVQIQEAKTMVEEDLQRRLEEFEDEKEQLQKAAAAAAALEQQLEQVKLTLHQRDQQLEALQQEHLGLLKQFASTQEALQSRERALGDLQVHCDELQAGLEELQGEAAARDDAIRFLQHEKTVLEVAVQAARSGREESDREAECLEEGAQDTSGTLEQLTQELAIKSSQVGHLQQEAASLKKQAQKIKEQFLQQKVMVEAYRRDATSKDQLIGELKAAKRRLDSEVKEQRQEAVRLHGEKRAAEVQHLRLQREAAQARQQLVDLEGHLQSTRRERDEMEMDLQSLQFDKEQVAALTEANEVLKKQIEELQQEATRAITEQKQKMKQLGSDLSSAQKEVKTKHKAYENAVGILSRRLQEALAAKEAAEAELSQLRAQVAGGGGSDHTLHERVQALEAELQAVGHSKRVLEGELQEVITLTSRQLEEQRERVLELEDELQESRGFRRKIKCLEESNKKLALDLEHERGKLLGLGQSSAALREHNGILETALAKREADLVQLNLQVQAVLQRKEEEDRQMKQLVQALQAALQKEKVTVHSLEEQVAAAQAEAGHSRRHFKAATLELSEVKEELQAKGQEVQRLQAEADGLQIQEGKHSQEIAQFQAELAEARTQLQLLQKQLDEQLSKEPVGNQEMENLKWEVDQKEREIQSLKQQLGLTERQSKQELDGTQQSLQNIKSELEMVREDLSLTRKDKFVLQAKVSELKSNMKTLLQQNQQLKLDLRRGAARMQRKEPKGEASSSSPVTPVKIPDCPVPASLLEELLRPPPAVSKEPLKNLNSCLQQLKQEMDSLQRQMEAHAVTVHESLSSWTQGDPASPSCLGEHANPRGDTEQHGQSRATRELFGMVTAEHPHPECL